MRVFSRPSISLDGEWQFVPDPERLYSARNLPEGESISVPGCWEAQVERPYRIITAWYRRSIDVPAEWAGSRIAVRFGAVMYRCRAWLNGEPIGTHEGGFTPFTLEAGHAIRPGANEMVVEVVNPLNAISEYPALAVDRVLLAEEWVPDLPLSQAPHGKQTWYSSQSGIWGSVVMERLPDVALDGIRVLPDPGNASATVRWSLTGDVGTFTALSLDVSVIDPDGATLGTSRHELPSGEVHGTFDVEVPEPRLWDIGVPNLYHLEVSLQDGGTKLDSARVRFGMRSVAVEAGHILLNGRPMYMLAALDQDLYPDTIVDPPSREFLEQQFRQARDMGLNLLRCHIKVPDPAYLEVADEVGLLVWCELPNWTSFSSSAARRGQETLRDMVEMLGNHPSIICWTIINEDWGTDLRFEARDRGWLREMVAWLKELDPTRLVVDNSACETPTTPNFHLETDLLDFHAYFLAPDNAVRWRNWVNDFARRPAWLWSPHGDARPTGDEPLVLSEFGSWGLPRLDALRAHYGGREPWWFSTGLAFYRPAGINRRFQTYGLDRIWPDVDSLATATQWHQFQNMQYEIGQIRRHGSIQGYVITEFTDANWEANGLLDVARGEKVFHQRLAAINAPDVVVAEVDHSDLPGGGTVGVNFSASSYGEESSSGTVRWRLELHDGQQREGTLGVMPWPQHTSHFIGRVEIDVPRVDATIDADFHYELFDAEGNRRGGDWQRLAVLPAPSSADPMALAVHDPLGTWGVRERLLALGHRVVDRAEATVLVATEVDGSVLDHAEAGGHVLVLVRSRDSLPKDVDLGRHVTTHLRRLPHAGWPGQRSPWEGDWVTSWSWLLPELQEGLPLRRPLDFAYEQVLPDHVLLGYEPARHRDEVAAGMFVGWIHTPAALEWTFPQGRGSVTLTTFRVSPEAGPLASHLLETLLRRAAGQIPTGSQRQLAIAG